MWRLYLQKYSGSVKMKNYLSQEVLGRFRTVDEAQKEISSRLNQAAKEGYQIIDASYFSPDLKQGFALLIGAEDETTYFGNQPVIADSIFHSLLKGGSVNAG